jgi:5-methyltetrahydropteroyltriglutamate--homocysteine methyltransferase
MDCLLHNHSSYPRIGDQPGQQRLRRAHADYERGTIDASGLLAIERSVIDEVIHEQEAAGVDVVTDGQVRWTDPISYLMGGLDGVRINGLLRYFDTNCYFRQPVVVGAIGRRDAMLSDDFAVARTAAQRYVKPVLTGPYTLARLSLIEAGPYHGVAALAEAFSAVVVGEVRALANAGAELIQIDEPAILHHPQDIRLLRQVMEPVWAARGAAQIILATYFGDAEPLYAQLNSVPADVVVFDVPYSPRLMDVIGATGASQELGLGIIDGRTTRLEDPERIAVQIDKVLARYSLERIHLLPSCGLEYLPRDCARAKLERLAAVRALLRL